jgi:iron complex transport system ATP-binding protein
MSIKADDLVWKIGSKTVSEALDRTGMSEIIALHDLNHAAMFCDRLIVMQAGKIVATGLPEEVLTRDLLRDVFSVEAHVETSPHHSRPHIHFVQ